MRAVGIKVLKNKLSEYVRLASSGEPILVPAVLARALDAFPVPVRTLDALHLASLEFLRTQGQHISIAACDRRLLDAADALGVTRSRYCS